MDKATLARAIEALEKLRQRPTMFLGTPTVAGMETFLGGFALACWAFGSVVTLELQREATYKRGWTFPAVGPVPQMREKGYSEEQVIDELVMIQITALQLLAEQAPS